MAELPFCPLSKLSSASKTSVLCRCLISVASLSIDDANTETVVKNAACLSLGIICVDTISAVSPNFLLHSLLF